MEGNRHSFFKIVEDPNQVDSPTLCRTATTGSGTQKMLRKLDQRKGTNYTARLKSWVRCQVFSISRCAALTVRRMLWLILEDSYVAQTMSSLSTANEKEISD